MTITVFCFVCVKYIATHTHICIMVFKFLLLFILMRFMCFYHSTKFDLFCLLIYNIYVFLCMLLTSHIINCIYCGFCLGVTVKVHLADISKGFIHSPVNVHAYLVQTVDELRSLISQV